MAYLGNKPVNNFVSFAKQNITGNGGTSYSLDYPVTGANDIELFINNVRQEPTEAYSCAGSTLTLTGAVSSTDDVYVIFRGRALQTAQHPSDSALEAASANIDNGTFVVDAVNNRVGVGTLTPANTFEIRGGNGVSSKIMADGNQGHFSIESSTTNYNWTLTNEGNVGRLRFMSYNGTTTRFPMYMYADTGIVTMPYQPAFFAASSAGDTNIGSATIGDFNITRVNVGGHYNTSTKTFTAPISGTYYFEAVFQGRGATATQQHALGVRINKNGSNYKDQYHGNLGGTTEYVSVNCTCIMPLSTGDTVNTYVTPGTTVNIEYNGGDDRCHFAGYLIG